MKSLHSKWLGQKVKVQTVQYGQYGVNYTLTGTISDFLTSPELVELDNETLIPLQHINWIAKA